MKERCTGEHRARDGARSEHTQVRAAALGTITWPRGPDTDAQRPARCTVAPGRPPPLLTADRAQSGQVTERAGWEGEVLACGV